MKSNNSTGESLNETKKNMSFDFVFNNEDFISELKDRLKNNQFILQSDERLLRLRDLLANQAAELEIKNKKIAELDKKLKESKNNTSEISDEINKKNQILSEFKINLEKARSQNEELIKAIHLKDKEIVKLHDTLTEIKAGNANLVARRELQMVKIKELNRELQYEIEIREKTEASLKKSNEAKDRFFSIIAHDLRNPFISIVNLVSILQEHAESFSKEELIELIGDLYTSAQSTQNLLENLLDWSKTQTNIIEVEPNFYQLKSIFDETMQVYKNHAEAKELAISIDIDSKTFVWVDKNMISTVIRNLLSNAIKFSHKNGKILINSKEVNDYAIIYIKDNGIGINPKNMDRLFRLDSKISLRGTSNEKGSGLGLILCKEFVEKNGGEIGVESKFGAGCTFSFTIPLKSIKH